jgi:sugar phosphate isomerase/epimerase
MPTYVSTSCLPTESNVFAILEAYARDGLTRIELGSRTDYVQDMSARRFRQYQASFIVHHYFPPPKQPLVVNLASQNADILQRSKDHIKKSLAFCHDLGCGLYSFHAGFRADPDARFVFPGPEHVCSYDMAFHTFIESVREIDEYARQKGVRIAVENNVLARHNVMNGQNPYLLLCTADEFQGLWDAIRSANVGLLLDLGHLKVSSHWLGFDRDEFVSRMRDRVFAVHLHENNGLEDQHLRLDKESWCLEVVRREHLADLPLVLEIPVASVQEIIDQTALVG